MTYNVFSGTLNPTHFTHFSSDFIIVLGSTHNLMTFQGPEKPNAEFQDFMQVICKFENFPQSEVHFARV